MRARHAFALASTDENWVAYTYATPVDKSITISETVLATEVVGKANEYELAVISALVRTLDSDLMLSFDGRASRLINHAQPDAAQ